MTESALLGIVLERLAPFGARRIVLFGSRARGDARPDSDLDLLVILDEVGDRRAAAVEMRRSLRDLPVAKDIIVAGSADAAPGAATPGSIIREALRRGSVVYERR